MLVDRKVESLKTILSEPVIARSLPEQLVTSSFKGRDVKVVDEKNSDLLRQFNNINWTNKSSLYGSKTDLLCKSLVNSIKEKRLFGL